MHRHVRSNRAATRRATSAADRRRRHHLLALEPLEGRTLLSAVPRPDHVVIVVEENHSNSAIIGSSAAPYINALAGRGASFTNSFAIEHPSQPNYLDLFSGSNQGVTDDSYITRRFTTPNLGAGLIQAGLSFGGYSQGLPAVGSTVESSGDYRSKHNPWLNWQGSPTNGIPAAANMPFTSFPADYSQLPTVSFVIPDMQNDMHDGSVAKGDTWLKSNLDGYVQWAQSHNSLLIVTFDEDDFLGNNQIATIFVGPMVQAGQYGETIDHFDVLRTVEDMYGLPYAGASAQATTITDVWAGTTTPTAPASPSSLRATAASSSQVNVSWADNATNESGFYVERSTSGTTFTQVAALAANVTAYSDTGLSAATTYTYRVRASNSTGNSAYSSTAAATTAAAAATAPAAATGLAASAASSSQVILTWADNATNESGFYVERSTNGLNFTQVAALAADVKTYSDMGLAASTTYTYRVRAYNAAGNSAYSGTAAATTPAAAGGQTPYGGTARAIPTTIQAEDFDAGGEAVAYHDTDAVNDGGAYRATGVDLQATGDAGGGYNVGWTAAGEWLEYTVDVAAAGTYTLEARVASGGGGGTFHVEFGGVNATGSLTIPDTGGWDTWRTLGVSAQLAAGSQVMRVAFDTNGSTGYVGNLNWVRLTATAAATAPAAPTGLAATAASSSQVNLSWADNAANESGFYVERSADGTNFAQVAAVAANVTSYSDMGLSASTAYTYRVRASNAAGNSAYSSTAAATTPRR